MNTLTNTMPSSRVFPILIEGLWSGEIGERDFVTRCASAGISFETVTSTLAQLRQEDGILA